MTVLVVAVVLAGPVPQADATTVDLPAAGGVDWYYWSPLSVVENISDLGGGIYLYEYSFVNVDSSGIWDFYVAIMFPAASVTAFSGYGASWSANSLPVAAAHPEYDARSLDSGIVALVATSTKSVVDVATAIQPTQAVSGLSFTASVFDPSPKYYMYETIASGYTQSNGTGKVAAVGITVPEPSILCLLGLGGVALARKRRA